MRSLLQRLYSLCCRNSICDAVWGERPAVLKRRTRLGRRIARVANFYFERAGIPICFFTDPQAWQAWEVRCFRMLNSPFFDAQALPGRRVLEEQLPGENIEVHLLRGTVRLRMVRAAGREFRRGIAIGASVFRVVGRTATPVRPM